MFVLITSASINAQTTVSSSIAAGSDDVEEDLGNGSVALGSSDLELGLDPGAQLVGLRFRGFNIPQGATITNAYVEFQVDEIKSNTGSVNFSGEDIDSPADFTTCLLYTSPSPRDRG